MLHSARMGTRFFWVTVVNMYIYLMSTQVWLFNSLCVCILIFVFTLLLAFSTLPLLISLILYWSIYLCIFSDNMSPMRYTADDVRDQLCLPPFHKEPRTQKSKRIKFPAKRNLCRVSNLLSVHLLGCTCASHFRKHGLFVSHYHICCLVCETCWTSLPFMAPVSGRYVEETYASRDNISGDWHKPNAWHWSMLWNTWGYGIWYWW